MMSGSKDGLREFSNNSRWNENKRENHHLWGKSERAIFAIITSLLLPIFISKLPIRQW